MSANVVPGPVHIHNYLHLVGVVILYYDYAITFGEEYTRIWKNRRTMSSMLFYINRYIPVLGDIAVNVGNFYIFPTQLVCRRYAFFRQLLLIVNQVVVCFVLFLRTFALYGRDWRVGASIFTFAMALLGISCWAVVGQHEEIELRGGCHLASDRLTAIRLAVAWESLFAFDLTIFSLTLWKTWIEIRARKRVTTGKNDIVALVLRDGAIYFAVMASANLANTLTFYVLEPLLRGCLSTAASSISVTMMSRLMLNLHGSAGANRQFVTTRAVDDPSDTSDNSTTLLFTSRITMPPLTSMWEPCDPPRNRESAYIRDPRAGHGDGYIGEVYELQDTHYHDLPQGEGLLRVPTSQVEGRIRKPITFTESHERDSGEIHVVDRV